MAIDHAYEKVVQAVLSLATGLGGLRERLADAYAYGLLQISPEGDVPRESLRLLEEIAARLSIAAGSGEQEVKAALARLSDSEAIDLAHMVVRLFIEVSTEYWRSM